MWFSFLTSINWFLKFFYGFYLAKINVKSEHGDPITWDAEAGGSGVRDQSSLGYIAWSQGKKTNKTKIKSERILC